MKVIVDSIYEPNAWVLPAESSVRRATPRNAKFKQPNYDQLYDSTTVAFDFVEVLELGKLVMLCPPLFNLEQELQDLRVTADDTDEPLKWTVKRAYRHDQIWIDTPKFSALNLRSSLGDFSILRSACAGHGQLFTGRRVLFTLSKNNNLEWIKDWIRFYRDIHGADAVLLYDNSSTEYSAQELCRELSSIKGIKAICVVTWPFKYGPPGFGDKHWESLFSQGGMLEHARWKYLGSASSVLNVDIDELVLAKGESIFEIAEASESGYVRFEGGWMVPVGEEQPSSPARLPLHRDFSTGLRRQIKWTGRRFGLGNICRSKWAVVPARCSMGACWNVHYVFEMKETRTPVKTRFGHFRAINNSWLYKRDVAEKRFKWWAHFRDREMSEALERVSWDS